MRTFKNDLGEIYNIPENQREREILDLHENLMYDLSKIARFDFEVQNLADLGYSELADDYSIDYDFEYPDPIR